MSRERSRPLIVGQSAASPGSGVDFASGSRAPRSRPAWPSSGGSLRVSTRLWKWWWSELGVQCRSRRGPAGSARRPDVRSVLRAPSGSRRSAVAKRRRGRPPGHRRPRSRREVGGGPGQEVAHRLNVLIGTPNCAPVRSTAMATAFGGAEDLEPGTPRDQEPGCGGGPAAPRPRRSSGGPGNYRC